MSDELSEKHHKRHLRSIWSYYGHGFSKAFKKSWGKYEKILIVFGIIYLLIAVCLRKKYATTELWGLDMSIWVQLIIPSFLLILFLVYHFVRAPYEIYVEMWKNTRDEIGSLEATTVESNQARYFISANLLLERFF
jgi:hypothetical protein